MRVDICIPVFNDWASATELVSLLDEVAGSMGHVVDVWFVDDGSSEPIPSALRGARRHLRGVRVLRLRRNLGHQRAIAVGLTHLYAASDCAAIVVMDGDGEDDPRHVAQLLGRLAERGDAVVFAKRTKRTESLSFRLGYVAFKTLHRIFTGRGVDVGNFSAIPRSALARLVSVSELWNHYAAAVHHARLMTDKVPLPRAHRIAGQSKMNFVSLVTHGLSAISVYGETVGVRLLCATAVGIGAVVIAGGVVAAVRFFTDLAIPGWATSAAGLLIVILMNMILLSAGAALLLLQSRVQATMIPLKDYGYYILEELKISASDAAP